jgi:branched-subunit amino acid aminotransferase/4-amino-4-deoxychorismate lyase
MDTLCLNLNGQLLPSAQAGLSVSNRAFRYGDGVFETLRIRDGKVLFFEEHMQRMEKGMKLLKMIPPSNFSAAQMKGEVERLMKKNNINKGGRVRINVYRDAAGLYTPEHCNTSFVIEAKTHRYNEFTLNEKGAAVGIYKERRLIPDCFSSIKSVSRLPYVLAGIYAREHQWDDCLLENQNGSLMEAVSSNLFLLMGNTFYTPPLSDGCLPGTMRQRIIQLIQEMGGTVIENSIRAGHLERVDEVFLTNSIQGIQWVGAYEQKRYFHKRASELIDGLNRITA